MAEVKFNAWELVLSCAWAPGGEILAAAAGEQVYLFHAQTLERQNLLQAGALSHSLAFNPQGTLLAVGSRDGHVRLWSIPPGSNDDPLMDLEAHKKGVNSVAFSPDGSLLATAGNDAVARLWEVSSGQVVGQIIGGTYAVPGIAFTLDGARLALINGPVVRLREVNSQRIAGTLRTEVPQYSIAFSPDGDSLALGDSDNTIRVFEADSAFDEKVSQALPSGVLLGHSGRKGSAEALIWGLSFSPDGGLLASAGGDGTARLWALPSGGTELPGDAMPSGGELVGTLQGHTKGVTCAAFSPDAQTLLTGSLDGSIKLWSIHP